MSHPFALVSVAEMRALEAAAIEAGTTEQALQERAGQAVADVVLPRSRARRGPVAAIVGPGNNGRDAMIAVRHLARRGRPGQLWLGPRHAVTDAEIAELEAIGVGVRSAGADGGTSLRRSLASASVLIDGLLGVGLRGPMRPELATIAEAVNGARDERSRLLVVAVDVPSGLDADDGTVSGVAIRADVTVTFGAVKTGLLRFPGASLVGQLVIRGIGLPPESTDGLPYRVLDESAVRPLLPDRPMDAHKYRLGRILAVAGSDRYVGAAYLCTAAAARSGCGLVGVASTEAVKQVLATRLPEATYPAPAMDLEAEPERTADQLAELLPEYQALLLGPGFGRSDGAERFLRRLLRANGRATRPVRVVIDADGLSLLARWEGWWEQIGAGHVLTPHGGEMARLIGSTDDGSGEAVWAVARHAAEKWGQIVVFKGPFTSVAAPKESTWVYPHANAALATAGTGDVLAGLCAGLVAQGVSGYDAARLAVVTGALAARGILAERGWRTLLATDLLEEIPRVLSAIERG